MIDADDLEREVDAEQGDLVVFDKATAREIIADLRRGHADRRALSKLRGVATVAAATAGMRVPDGYSAPDQVHAA